jgi:hypothetical protein
MHMMQQRGGERMSGSAGGGGGGGERMDAEMLKASGMLSLLMSPEGNIHEWGGYIHIHFTHTYK